MPNPASKSQVNPPQHQNRQPGIESEMNPLPVYESESYKAAGKLKGKTAIITGGDSGIGRAVAVAYAKEGADVAIVYLNEHGDAEKTKEVVEKAGVKCLLIAGDVGDEAFCKSVIEQTISEFGKLDILVNNAAEQHVQQKLEDITSEQLVATFRTNVFSMFYLTIVALPHLKASSSIINTASITAYRGNPTLIDYSATKGAIVSFTRALSVNVAGQGIRVNGVAPGPIWTPLIPATFDDQAVAEFGSDTPMKRPGQPHELAAAYVYLACDDSSYMTGQFLHINGGEVVNG
ncbi:NAD(P)-dependent dehydrogenase (short-subunit alcohol dehydrogenase family) [Paenibacillus endophyticus]|uniref:NAD(P)-dependent dehydrogenase (Short-subunit alcohol dehydrogenase family) n=1 Tax=Paenibacillus endophyticus TaxID=1294268 RepID=A0A7W5C758_9BACL|nr:SDR family oxidoreductase [Paenibacillus endophyticus]MBB3152346.1 NAD(P)-dependent dehydrogenase (short-subunit alcohol dehydrogenase family) [Paenibacillus endophyticus]